MPVLTRDTEVRVVPNTDVDPQEFFDRWQEAPDCKIPQYEPEPIPNGWPQIPRLQPGYRMDGLDAYAEHIALVMRPSVTLNINANMLSEEEHSNILNALSKVRNGGDVARIVHEELANGSVEIEVESYSVGCGPVGDGEISITGQMNPEDIREVGVWNFSHVGWGHYSSIGLCTPSRDNMITGLAVNGQAR